ncbi:MAG: hypothetical protein LBH07_06990 [Treponema sp.]|jgi:hypothetical protein|nr:hypothetical protein [Treponema sp.]
MKPENIPNTEPEKELSEDNKHIYFSMNMPNWFMNKDVDEKCKIVKALADQLKDEKPISPQQKKELFSIEE